MNGIRYPAEEIAKSYQTLNRTPAPFGHPFLDNQSVSAFDPEAINIFHIGAWNENARQEDGRVKLDKVIDVERAKSTENGQRVLDAIENGDPIHTSTGLTAMLEALENDDEADFSASDLEFDHDAILIDEEGAATPEQGVGMLVNGKNLSVINSSLEEDLDEQMDWAIRSLMRTMEEKEQLPIMERIKKAIAEAFSAGSTTETQENADMANEKEFADLQNGIDKLTTAVEGMTEAIANAIGDKLQPLTDAVEEIQNSQKADVEARNADKVKAIVENGLLEEDEAKELPQKALDRLFNKVKGKDAKNLNSSFETNDKDKDEFEDYDMNAHIKEEKK